jgi:hypothetical protein
MLMDGVISEAGLLTVCKEVITEKGPSPVGEIGKMLQELTSKAQFSNKLKETYGGLKKFLEKSEDFLITADHPFNPHVFLRKSLTGDDIEVLTRENITSKIVVKYKKVKLTPSHHLILH